MALLVGVAIVFAATFAYASLGCMHDVYLLRPAVLCGINVACYAASLLWHGFYFRHRLPSKAHAALAAFNVLVICAMPYLMALVLSDTPDRYSRHGFSLGLGLEYAVCMAKQLVEMALWLSISETVFYALHRAAHVVQPFYRVVHSVHHRYNAVNPWATQFVHPVETLLITYPTMVIPWFIVRPSFPVLMGMAVVAIWHNVSAHTGSPAERFHKLHHSQRSVNFGTMAMAWDTWLGTKSE